MEPTADIDLSPQLSARERVERIINLGVLIFVLAMIGTLLVYRFG